MRGKGGFFGVVMNVGELLTYISRLRFLAGAEGATAEADRELQDVDEVEWFNRMSRETPATRSESAQTFKRVVHDERLNPFGKKENWF